MFTEIEKQMMLELAENFTAGQIAEKFKGDVHIVRTWLVKNGINPLTEGDIITYRLYHEAHNYTKQEMRERLNINVVELSCHPEPVEGCLTHLA